MAGSFSFLEVGGGPRVEQGTATLAGFCLEGAIRIGDTVHLVQGEHGWADVELAITDIDDGGPGADQRPWAATLTVTGEDDDIAVISAGAMLSGDQRSTGACGPADAPLVASPGTAPDTFVFEEERGDPRIGPGTATFAGKGLGGVIRVGDRVRAVLTGDGVVAEVDLAITDIGLYGQYVSELEPALAAELTVIGDDVDRIVAGTTMWGTSMRTSGRPT